MTQLGNGLDDAGLYEEWLNVLEVDLANETRFGACEVSLLQTRCHMAICYSKLDRDEEALALRTSPRHDERSVQKGKLSYRSAGITRGAFPKTMNLPETMCAKPWGSSRSYSRRL